MGTQFCMARDKMLWDPSRPHLVRIADPSSPNQERTVTLRAGDLEAVVVCALTSVMVCEAMEVTLVAAWNRYIDMRNLNPIEAEAFFWNLVAMLVHECGGQNDSARMGW